MVSVSFPTPFAIDHFFLPRQTDGREQKLLLNTTESEERIVSE